MFPAAAPPTPNQTEVLDGISRAFFATMDGDGGPRFLAVAGCLAVASIGWLLYWLRRETRRDTAEQALLDARHQAAMARTSSAPPGTDWMTIPARRRVTIQHPERGGRFWYEEAETLALSGGAITLSCKAPPARGAPLHFSIDLGEKAPMPLHGVVVRVDQPPAEGALSIVEARLGPVTEAEREHLVRWITHEEERQIAEARRGRLCSACGRPLPEDGGSVHPSCARQAAASVAPRG